MRLSVLVRLGNALLLLAAAVSGGCRSDTKHRRPDPPTYCEQLWQRRHGGHASLDLAYVPPAEHHFCEQRVNPLTGREERTTAWLFLEDGGARD